MEERLKKRLVGSVIFISLAIIFFPLIFDGNERERVEFDRDIPDPPRVDMGEGSLEEIEKKISEREKASALKLPLEVADEKDYSNEPDFQLDKNGLPVNWTIQVGSFQEKGNAIRLRARLRENNFKSYILSGKSSTGDWYRVFVGPLSSRNALKDIKLDIEKRFKISGHIVRQRIEQDSEQLGG